VVLFAEIAGILSGCGFARFGLPMLSFGHRCLLLLIVGLAVTLGCGKTIDPQQELLTELTHTDVEQRRSAVFYLAAMRPVPEIYIQPLMQALNDNDPQVRQGAAEALGETGPGGRSVLNDLAKISHEHVDPQVRYTLQLSVKKISQSQ
jgi:HEAT repeat protein